MLLLLSALLYLGAAPSFVQPGFALGAVHIACTYTSNATHLPCAFRLTRGILQGPAIRN